jgi:hypothetical protein
MCTRSIAGVKRLGHGVNQLPLSGANVKERVELYLYSSSLLFFGGAGYRANLNFILFLLASLEYKIKYICTRKYIVWI